MKKETFTFAPTAEELRNLAKEALENLGGEGYFPLKMRWTDGQHTVFVCRPDDVMELTTTLAEESVEYGGEKYVVLLGVE
jgi:predicted RNase H-like HicB family nuclease